MEMKAKGIRIEIKRNKKLNILGKNSLHTILIYPQSTRKSASCVAFTQ